MSTDATTERPETDQSESTEVEPHRPRTILTHMFDPNYYRLGHQLVAEYANRAAAIMLAPGTTVSHASLITDGLQETSDRLDEIGAVLADLTDRHESSTFWVVDPPLKNQAFRAFQVAQQQAGWDLHTAKGVLDDGCRLAVTAKDRFDAADDWLRIGPSERRGEASA